MEVNEKFRYNLGSTLKLRSAPTESTINLLTGQFDDPLTSKKIEVYDNTLREGEQAPGVVFSPNDKLALARELDAFGTHWANVGFPAASKQERDAVELIAKAGLRMKIAALSRISDSDIDATVDSGVQMVSLFLGGSDVHLNDKLKIDEATALARIEAGVSRVRERGAQAAFTIEDGSRTPMDRLLRMFRCAADAGADYLILADTVGILTPISTGRIVAKLVNELPKPIGLHFHDDLGLALANTVAGLHAGAQMAHTTMTGPGERSGNVCLAELAVVLQLKYGTDLGLRLELIEQLAQRVYRMSGTTPPPHKAVTGKWCFTHESGIHVAGMLAHPETYQPYAPSIIGREHHVVFGKHSGVAALRYAADEIGLRSSEVSLKRVLDRVKTGAESQRHGITDDQVRTWLREESERDREP